MPNHLSASSTDGLRLAFGCIVLNIVNILQTTPKFTILIFDDHLRPMKPLFYTYTKFSSLAIFTIAVCFSKTWCDYLASKLMNCNSTRKSGHNHSYAALQQNDLDSDVELDSLKSPMSESSFIPISAVSSECPSELSGSDSDRDDNRKQRDRVRLEKPKKIRFNRLMEVRHLNDTKSKDNVKARLSYASAMQLEEEALREQAKLKPQQVIALSFPLMIFWFASEYCQQMALSKLSNDVLVYAIMTTSCIFVQLFILCCSHTSRSDAFSLAKLLATCISLYAVYKLASDVDNSWTTKIDSVWALLAAFFISLFLVSFRRAVRNEECIDVAILLGTIGTLSLLLLWPLLIFAHLTGFEQFNIPTISQISYLLVTSAISTSTGGALWLWSALLTSSLITSLAGYTLMVPLMQMFNYAINADTLIPVTFYVWSALIIACFIVVGILTTADRDPISWFFLKLIGCICGGRGRVVTLRDQDLLIANEIT